jgi:hypothetical protein
MVFRKIPQFTVGLEGWLFRLEWYFLLISRRIVESALRAIHSQSFLAYETPSGQRG